MKNTFNILCCVGIFPLKKIMFISVNFEHIEVFTIEIN